MFDSALNLLLLPEAVKKRKIPAEVAGLSLRAGASYAATASPPAMDSIRVTILRWTSWLLILA